MARVSHYDVGDVWTPQATFTVGGTNTDPTNLTVKQQAPDGTETTLLNNVLVSTLTGSSTPVAKTATGIFKLNPGISLTAAGHYYVNFAGTGAATAAEEFEAIADPSEFALDGGVSTRALVTLGEAKDWLNQNNIDTGEDLELVRLINDISDRFYDEADREFKVLGTNPQTRTFAVDNVALRYGKVFVGDLTSFTQVQTLDTDWTTVLETVNLAYVRGLPLVRKTWEPIRSLEFNRDLVSQNFRSRYLVKVTGNWGFPSVPGNVRQAVLDAIAAIRDRDVERYSTDLAPATAGGEANVIVIGNAGPRVVSLPPSSLAVAYSYRDPVIG